MPRFNIVRLLVISLWSTTVMAATPQPRATVTGGVIQGRLLPDSGAVFKGIPFAAPPVGELRWREPAPVVSWSGVREASNFSASCVQAINDWNRQEAIGNKEDCLYLNVWTNEWPARTRKPVMVWIYGGGNTAGGASVNYFDGASLARRGVVLVTFNYRMGLFGFFAHPALAGESSHYASGNYALLDHQAALRWVRDNITQFGGDPNNVTLFGQSAGAGNTNYQLASSLSKGLFHKAIQQSGAGIRDMASRAEAEKAGERFVASLNLAAGKEGIKALRAMPAEQLRLQAVAAARGAHGPTMAPSVDGYVLTMESQRAMLTGRQHRVPLLIGSNAQEQGGPEPEELRQQIAAVFGANTDKALALYGLSNGGAGKTDSLYGSTASTFQADTNQRCQATQAAIWHATTGQPVYLYQYDHAIAGQAATRHSAEVPYLFGNLLSNGFLSGGPYTEVDRKISADLQTYWTNFAKTGDPNSSSGMPKWEKFDAKRRAMLEFTDGGPVLKEGLRREICDFYMDSLRQHLSTRS